MFAIIAQFDPLSWAAIIGSALFLAGLIWVLVDDRDIQQLNRPHSDDEWPGDGAPSGPSSRRAA